MLFWQRGVFGATATVRPGFWQRSAVDSSLPKVQAFGNFLTVSLGHTVPFARVFGNYLEALQCQLPGVAARPGLHFLAKYPDFRHWDLPASPG